MAQNIHLAPPWEEYCSKLKCMFGKDPGIRIETGETPPPDPRKTVTLHIDDPVKALAVRKLLPFQKTFGNVTLDINVRTKDPKDVSRADIFRNAFAGNPNVKDVVTIDSPFGKFSYVVFKNEVVQFFNDRLDDLNGNTSTLYQDIAADLFGTEYGTFYSTEPVNDEMKKPLGEWP